MELDVSRNSRFSLSSTSKGNQIKWFSNNMYIKADTMGCEGIVEALVSELLKYIDFQYGFIDYFPCSIKEGGNSYNGCYSYNYLSNEESFVSIYRVLQLADKGVQIKLNKLSGLDLVNFVVETVRQITSIDMRDYLSFLINLDALILNEDRHFNNICLVKSGDKFRLAPVFDNGLSLLSDIDDYPLNRSLRENIKKVKSKPFSTSFRKQLSYFDNRLLKIDIEGFAESVRANEDVFTTTESKRSRQVLLYQLEKYEGVLWERI